VSAGRIGASVTFRLIRSVGKRGLAHTSLARWKPNFACVSTHAIRNDIFSFCCSCRCSLDHTYACNQIGSITWSKHTVSSDGRMQSIQSRGLRFSGLALTVVTVASTRGCGTVYSLLLDHCSPPPRPH
jgi:hypothetical protein